jgi:hypothetical protein
MSQSAALLLSLVTEALAALVLLRAWGEEWGRATRAALAAVLATLLTHPAAWAATLRLMDAIGYAAAVALVEAAVVLAESLAYRVLVPLPGRRALLASLVANGASAGLGLVLYALGLA